MMSEQKKFFLTLALSCCVSLLLAAFTFVVNYFKFNSNELFLISDARYYNSILIKKFDFDSVIIGSSLSQCFKCSDFDTAFQAKSMKLTMVGANLAEIGFMLEQAEKHRDLKYLMLEVPVAFLKREQNLDKIENGYYGANTNLFYMKKSFSVDFFCDAFHFASKFCRGKIKYTNRDDIYAWDKKRACGEEYFAENTLYKPLPYVDCTTPESIEMAKLNMQRYLLPILKKHKNSRILVFLPPFSIMFYQNIDMDEYIKLKRELLEMLLQFEHVQVYDFETAFHITGDFDRYLDLVHYSGKVNTWIIESMAKGDYLITKENREEQLQRLHQHVRSYDFQKARDYLEKVHRKQKSKQN